MEGQTLLRGFLARHRGAVVAGIVIAVALTVFGLIWFQPQKLFIDERVAEDLPAGGGAGATTITLASGEFRPLAHDVTGSASIVEIDSGERYVRFEDDFSVENGPDLVVYLSEAASDGQGRAFAEDFIELGRLKGNIGSQNYLIPAGTDLSRYRSVVVWCRRFTVGFAVAPLEA